MSAAVGSASMCSYLASSTISTFSTPSSFAAASAAARQFEPATRMCTGAPSALAAVSAFAVPSFKEALSCSAMRRVVMRCPCALEHAGFDFELLDELGDGSHLDAGLAPAGLDRLHDPEARRDVDAERLGRGLLERLLLRLHDV